MGDILKGVEYLGIPTTIAIAVVGLFLLLQVIGEIVELCGKVVPEMLKVRKYFSRKAKEKKDAAETLKKVQALLSDVQSHYSKDNITKRDEWMKGVDNRAITCGDQMADLKDALLQVTEALNTNTKMTEEMFVQSSRDRIIDFATKVGDENAIVSREEFNRIFKVYNKYEEFLKEHQMTNGEVDVAYQIINDAYAYRLTHHSFLENIRGYDK